MDDFLERLKPDADQMGERESRERLAEVMAHDARAGGLRRAHVAAAAAVLATVGLGTAVTLAALDDRPDDDRAAAEGECRPLLRLDGVVYVAVGYLEGPGREATRVGRADIADCDDEGPSPGGATFPSDPRTVVVHSFAGQPVEVVVGTDFPTGYEVYVAETVPQAQHEEILEELRSVR